MVIKVGKVHLKDYGVQIAYVRDASFRGFNIRNIE